MIANWQRFFRDHYRAIDAVVVLVLFGNAFAGATFGSSGTSAPLRWWPGVLLTGVACAALLKRREHPRAVAVLAAVCACVVTALGYLPTVLLLGPLMLALYALADRTDRRTANTVALTTIVLVSVLAMLAGPHQPIALTVIGPAALLLLPTALGTVARLRRAYLEAVQARADHAERTREEEARHRVAEERMRIARELHDVVAHHLALANAQAGTAAHLARSHPEQAQKLLAELTATTSSALRELKATVGLLRQTDDPDAPLQPAPGLAQLPELTASLASVGLTVTTTTRGQTRPLSPAVDLTAFRIVQEALTNVTKHAATKTASVQLTYTCDRLTITVTDDLDQTGKLRPVAAASATPGGGFGLIGMRERARSVDGTLQAGPRPEGGYQVTAELPLHPETPEEDPRP